MQVSLCILFCCDQWFWYVFTGALLGQLLDLSCTVCENQLTGNRNCMQKDV